MEGDEGDEHVPKEHLELLKSVLSDPHVDQSDGEEEEQADDTWSEEEKDRFFAALSSHSPLRPDLIAECVGSKNISEVCVYLAVLEEASKSSETESLRASLDIAMEVTDDWLEVEEDQAKFSRDLELAWIPDTAEGDGVVDVSTRRQAALKALSFPHLKAMDKLLQEDPNTTEQPPPPAPAAAESRDEPELASDLNAAERRRLQKRLYMRRKRAEASGKQFNADTLKLQRGRPKKASGANDAADDTPSNELPAEVSSGSDSGDSESEEDVPREKDGRRKRKRKRGKTKEQQAIESFNELGIDSSILANENLDLFHLASLGRLLKLYREAYSPSPVSSMSFSVIRLLTIILTDFVTQVLHRSILLREQELQLKAQTKVWHLEDDSKDLCTDDIEKALAILGYATSKKEVLEHLSKEASVSENDEIPEDESDDGPGSVGELDTPIQDDFPMLPERDTLLDLHPPTIRLREDTLKTTIGSQGVLEALLLPTETDDEMLEQELIEEEALDKQDEARERNHQQELWADYDAQMAAFRQKES